MLSAHEGIEVIAEASGLAALEESALEADVWVAAAGVVSAEELRRWARPEATPPALLIFTDEPGAARQLAGLPLRAWGVLPLDASEDELLAAVQALHEGLFVGAPALVQPLLGRSQITMQEGDALVEELTQREGEVLSLLAEGLANKQIALALGISEHTVKFHISSIYNKLGVTNRTEAVRAGARLGLIVL